MSSSDPAEAPKAQAASVLLPERPWLWLALSLCAYALVTPPVGALIGLVMLAAFATAGSDAGFVDAFLALWGTGQTAGVAGLYAWPLLAVLPAAAIGAFFGWHIGWRGPVPRVGAVFAGAGVGALYFLVGEFFGWGIGVYGASFAVVVSGLTVLVLLPLLSALERGSASSDDASTP